MTKGSSAAAHYGGYCARGRHRAAGCGKQERLRGDKTTDVYRRQQNEKVTFWNIVFGVGAYTTCSNDGQGECKRWGFFAANSIWRTTAIGSDTGDECLCCT
jgi:hypothetical protein